VRRKQQQWIVVALFPSYWTIGSQQQRNRRTRTPSWQVRKETTKTGHQITEPKEENDDMQKHTIQNDH